MRAHMSGLALASCSLVRGGLCPVIVLQTARDQGPVGRGKDEVQSLRHALGLSLHPLPPLPLASCPATKGWSSEQKGQNTPRPIWVPCKGALTAMPASSSPRFFYFSLNTPTLFSFCSWSIHSIPGPSLSPSQNPRSDPARCLLPCCSSGRFPKRD